MPGFSAVIFDMYETLVQNSPALWVKTFDEICRVQGLPLTGQQLWEKWRPIDLSFREERYTPGYPFRTYAASWHECFVRVFKELGRGDADQAIGLSMLAQANRPAYSEAAQVVAALHDARPLKVAVLSNADNVALNALVRLHGFPLDAVVSSETARAYKPVRQAFDLMLQRLGVPAAQCLYVGDSQHDDVQGAKAVGMQAAWINRNGAKRDAKYPAPDYTISNLLELLAILSVKPD
ncbi:MAG: HAD family hydrolase [Chloroflexi bacterium]|nr:HAD family hydrolase [Chloroflexota bacterium]